MERVLREDVFDIGDEQFLMLLLVMNSEGEDRLDFVEEVLRRRRLTRSSIDRSIAARYRYVSSTVGREIKPRRSRRCMSPAAL